MLKKTIVLTLFFSLFFMLLTSLVMYIVPPARVASWADWAFLGISRAHWEGAHLGMGLLFCAAGLAHLLLNWDSLLDYLRDADGVVVVFTRPFFFGLILSLFVFVGALAGLPPVKQLVTLSNYIKDRAVEVYGEPPYSMAERATLAEFARRMGMEQDKALALLRMRNIKAESANLTLAEIARQNGVAPGGVFEALKMVMEPSGGTAGGLPKDPPPGLGRRKLSDICEEYSLDIKAVMSRLEGAGMRAQPAWTLAEVAKVNNVLPISVYEVLRAEKNTVPVQVEVSSSPASAETKPQPVTPEPQPQPVTPPAPQPAAPPATQQAVQTPGRTIEPHQSYQPSLPHEQPMAAQTPVPFQPAPVQQQPVQQQPVQPQSGYQPAAQPQTGYQQPGYQPPVQAQLPPQAVQPALPAAPPPGLEKMMLQTFCREYNLPLSTAVQRLARHNITAFGDMTFEELSLENNRTPKDILHLVTGQ